MDVALTHIKVLLVEDNPGDQVLIEEYLKQVVNNPIISFATTFAETKSLLQSANDFDIVLLDLALPDASGSELVLDTLKLTKDTPIIVLTGYGNKAFGLTAISLGVDDYLLKDEINSTYLNKSIAYAIERKRIKHHLEISEKKYRGIFEFNPIAMYVYDAETKKILDVNEAAVRQYGYTRVEFLNLSLYDLRSADQANAFEEAFRTVRNNDNPLSIWVFEHQKKDGTKILVELQNTNIDYDGSTAGIVIANDITERTKAEEQIRKSEERYRAVAQTAKDAIITIDTHGIVIDWNTGAENIFGYTKAEMIGDATMLHQIIPEHFRKQHVAGIQKVSAGNHTKLDGETIEMEGLHKSGKIIPISFSLAEWETEEGRFCTAIVRDISESKKMLKMLKETNDYLENLFNYANAPIIVWDRNFCITRFNHAFEVLTGYEETDVLGKHLELLFPAHKKQESIREIEKTLSGTYWESVEIEIQHQNGSIKTALWNSANIFDADEKTIVATIAQGQDITERKKAEEELYRKQQFILEAQRIAKLGYYIYHIDTGMWEGSNQIYEMMGLTPSFKKNIQEWTAIVVPKQQEKMHAYFFDAINNLTPFDAEYKIYNKQTKQYKWLKGVGNFEFDANNKPMYMVGTIQDITAAKEEEIRLKLLESVITNTTDGVAITEVDDINPHNSKIIYINRAYERMTGYTLEEVSGKNPRILQGPKTQREPLDKMKLAIEMGEPYEIEVINYRKNKQAFWTSVSISPLKDNTGKITHWIGIKRDITKRKEQEQEREQLIRELTLHNKDLRQFSFITSHNLRAPLSNLLGLLNLIKDLHIEDNSLKEIIEGFKVSTQHLNDTINDLIKILIIKDKPSVEQEEIDLANMIQTVCHKLSGLAESHGTQPIINLNLQHASSVFFNRSYFESILMQLLSNAIIFQSPDRPLEIEISSNKTTNGVELSIKDNGIGLNMERYQDRLFGLYQRFHAHTTTKGLGLYLVKSQLEALGGSVAFNSTENVGTELLLQFKGNKND
jgi:PAS domain S-box-containing protein